MQNMKIKTAYVIALVALAGFFGHVSMTQASGAPIMSTTPTGTYTETTATLSGFYTDNGSPTSTWFQYSTSPTLIGAVSTLPVLQAGPSGPYTKTITGLTSDTWYYYRAVGQNAYGTTYATSIYSFKTLGGGGGGSCTVDSFTASPTTITSGNSSTLSWNTTNCSTVTVSGIGGVFSPDSSVVSPTLTSTTTYTLTATGDTTDTATLTVTVNPIIVDTCSITSLYASPSMVDSGNSSTLYWNTTGCTTVSISGGTLGGSYPVNSSANTGALYSGTTYTLTASGSNTTSSSVYVGINAIVNLTCYVSSFYASPSSTIPGGSTTLYWNTTGCSSVTLSGGIFGGTTYSTNGSLNTGSVYTNTTYTLTAYGSNTQSATTLVSIFLIDPPNTSCNDQFDNDGDGKVDMADPGCTSIYDTDEYDYVAPPTPPPTYSYACSDGIDNDGDGRVDMVDTGCYATTDTSEYNLVAGQTISDTFGGGANVEIQNGAGGYRTYNHSNLAGLALFGGFLPNSLLAWLLIILLIMGIVYLSRKVYAKPQARSIHH